MNTDPSTTPDYRLLASLAGNAILSLVVVLLLLLNIFRPVPDSIRPADVKVEVEQLQDQLQGIETMMQLPVEQRGKGCN
jgi:hypothetical protein